MLYTDQSIRFTASEIKTYSSMGVDVAQIKTYRQFVQMVNSDALLTAARVNRQRKENPAMAKRFGRRALNGTMEYYDTYEELRAAQRRENAHVRTACFGFIGRIAGGLFAYALLQWLQVDSRIVRFVGTIAGMWLGGVLAAVLSALLWTVLKWAIGLTVIVVIGLFIWFVV